MIGNITKTYLFDLCIDSFVDKVTNNFKESLRLVVGKSYREIVTDGVTYYNCVVQLMSTHYEYELLCGGDPEMCKLYYSEDDTVYEIAYTSSTQDETVGYHQIDMIFEDEVRDINN